MQPRKLTDRHNRHLNYLRISITDRCNLKCIYCTPSDRIPRLMHSDILRYEEILRVVRIGIRLGITKVRVTGGEPLVRKGAVEFLDRLSHIEGLAEVTLTTNGVLLLEHLNRIQTAGIHRINISLDTLQAPKFKDITGKDLFQKVWAGIQTARKMGFHPIKLNMVALRGVNDDELLDFARLTVHTPIHVRYIEYMPIGASQIESGPPLLVPEIKDRVRKVGDLEPIEHDPHDGPAERFRLTGAQGEIGFISALSHHFCSTCNRLRLTSSGQLRPCLLSDRQVDLRGPLRNGSSDDEIAEIIRCTAREKPSDHNLSANDPAGVTCQMSSIGG